MSITISPCFTVLNQLLHPHFINLWMPTFWLIFDSNLVEYFKLIIRINSTYISIFCECMMTCKSTECYQWWLYSQFIDLVSQCFQYFLSTIFNAEVWVFYVRTPAWMLLTVQLTYHEFLVRLLIKYALLDMVLYGAIVMSWQLRIHDTWYLAGKSWVVCLLYHGETNVIIVKGSPIM